MILSNRLLGARFERQLTKGDKSVKLWLVNILSFMLFAILAFTGLINWFLLPRGYAAGRGASTALRHGLVDIHQWAGLLFIVIVGIHLFLHRRYIKANWDRMVKAQGDPPDTKRL